MQTSPDTAAMKDFVVENLIPKKTGSADRDRQALGLGKSLLPGLTEQLRAEVAEKLDLSLSAQIMTSMGAAFGDLGDNGAVATYAQGEDKPHLAVALDGEALAFVTSMLFGGDPSVAVAPSSREPSAVEREVLGFVANTIGTVLAENGFAGLSEPSLFSVREFISTGAADFEVALFTYTMTLGPNGGTLRIALPDVQTMSGDDTDVAIDPGPLDASWNTRFSDEIMRAHMRLEVRLSLEKLTLGALAGLQAGDVLTMASETSTECLLTVRGQPVFTGQFGRLGDRYSIRIDEPCHRSETIVDEIMRSI